MFASVKHAKVPFSAIIATPFIPQTVEKMIPGGRGFFCHHGVAGSADPRIDAMLKFAAAIVRERGAVGAEDLQKVQSSVVVC